MARSQRLKVFRTAIGFHDAFVAAPSRKAALEAWGAKSDLFAIGSAELVTDPALTAAPLAEPGKVITRTRGSLSDQLAALPAARKPKPEAGEAPKAVPSSKPRPRPSRAKLDAAERKLQALEEEGDAAIEALRREEEELRRRRAALEKKRDAQSRTLRARVAEQKDAYDAAMARWRAAD